MSSTLREAWKPIFGSWTERCEFYSARSAKSAKVIRQCITKRGLSGPKAKTLHAVANYLYRNRSRMRYDEYLANGWPIASGPVEGACKNLIKDCMERSGMRWTEQMAEAIVQLRAIYLSGDFDRYWQFHIDQDQRRLPHRLDRRSKVATPLSFSRLGCWFRRPVGHLQYRRGSLGDRALFHLLYCGYLFPWIPAQTHRGQVISLSN
jgi:hypothetical protein